MDRASWGRGLPYEQWPEQDRAMWAGLTEAGDDFDSVGAFARLRESSRDGYRLAYAQWLKHLMDEGHDLSIDPPDARATVPRLRRYAQAVAHLAPRTQALRFNRLHRVLSSAYPGGDWRQLSNAKNALHRRANAAGPVRTQEQVPPSDTLLEAGTTLIGEACRQEPFMPLHARLWRDGLLVSILACHAPRRRTITALTLGGNFRRDDLGYAIWASAEDMKAGRPCLFRVSSLLKEAIDGYLSRARPLFPNGEDPERGPLWLAFTGRALGPQGIKGAVAAITEVRTGRRTTTHGFRHAALTTMANAEGFDTRHGQAFLDHRTPEISERHYNMATQLDAGRAYATLLDKKRTRGGRR
ncbi:MAG: hypothetical protein AAGH68_12595 [Pseudomonadota bacterium]